MGLWEGCAGGSVGVPLPPPVAFYNFFWPLGVFVSLSCTFWL